MGLLSRLLGWDPPLDERASTGGEVTRLVVLDGRSWPEDLEVVGEAYHQAAFKAIFEAIGDDSGGVLNRIAVLRAEPQNPYDRNAVAVEVDGLAVGHIPAGIAPRVQPLVLQAARRGELMGVPARIWARNDGLQWNARVTLSTGPREDEWTYAGQQRDRRAAREAGARNIDIEEARSKLDESDAVSLVRGKHYSEWVATIENWKRSEKYDQALALLDECQCSAEADAAVWRRPPAPWYYEQAAIIHRKGKDYAAEVAVLQRYMAAAALADCSHDTAVLERIDSRLYKAKKLAGL